MKKGAAKESGCTSSFADRSEGIRVYQFLRGPLTDAFGEEFYSALEAAAKMLIAAS